MQVPQGIACSAAAVPVPEHSSPCLPPPSPALPCSPRRRRWPCAVACAHQAHIPAIPHHPQAAARLPGANGNQERAARAAAAPVEGPPPRQRLRGLQQPAAQLLLRLPIEWQPCAAAAGVVLLLRLFLLAFACCFITWNTHCCLHGAVNEWMLKAGRGVPGPERSRSMLNKSEGLAAVQPGGPSAAWCSPAHAAAAPPPAHAAAAAHAAPAHASHACIRRV